MLYTLEVTLTSGDKTDEHDVHVLNVLKFCITYKILAFTWQYYVLHISGNTSWMGHQSITGHWLVFVLVLVVAFFFFTVKNAWTLLLVQKRETYFSSGSKKCRNITMWRIFPVWHTYFSSFSDKPFPSQIIIALCLTQVSNAWTTFVESN